MIVVVAEFIILQVLLGTVISISLLLWAEVGGSSTINIGFSLFLFLAPGTLNVYSLFVWS